MTNYQLLKILRGVLVDGLAAQGYSPVRVCRSFQQAKTSAPAMSAVIFNRVNDIPEGWQRRHAVVNPDGSKTITEQHNFTTVFQVNALVPQPEPGNEQDDDKSSFDLLRLAFMLLQGSRMLDTCKQNGIGIQVIETFNQNWVKDEHDNWEAEPSFNISITVKETLTWDVPAVDRIDAHIYRV